MSKPVKLPRAYRHALSELYRTRNFREGRCPTCWTFHRRDCEFDSQIAGAIELLVPDILEILKDEEA